MVLLSSVLQGGKIVEGLNVPGNKSCVIIVFSFNKFSVSTVSSFQFQQVQRVSEDYA